VVGEPVGVLEDLQPPRSGYEGPAQAVYRDIQTGVEPERRSHEPDVPGLVGAVVERLQG